MSINVNDKNLGHATAYAYYKAGGGTMTEAEFTEFMADFGTASQTAVEAAQAALASETAAQTAATTATNKASEASQSASAAHTDAESAAQSASQAQTSAQTASTKASEASQSASTASTKAGEATTAAGTATTAKNDAVAAQTAAETAQGKAETAQEAAEDAAESVSASAAQIATNTADITELKEDITSLENGKANVDGYYADLVSGGSTQLLSDMVETDTVPYNYRTAGGSLEIGDRMRVKEFVGVSMPINQLAGYNATAGSTTINGVTFTINSDGSVDVSGEASEQAPFNIGTRVGGHSGHVRFVKGCPNGGSVSSYSMKDGYGNVRDIGNGGIDKINSDYSIAQIIIASGYAITGTLKFKPQIIDLTLMLGTTIADYVYTLESGTAGTGIAWLKKYFPKIFDSGYIPYNAGSMQHVTGLSASKTVGFNQWDEEWEVGRIDTTTGENKNATGIRTKNHIPVFPNTAYYAKCPQNIYVIEYDANKSYVRYASYKYNQTFTTSASTHYIRFYMIDLSTYSDNVCINLHWDGELDGTYKPYEEHVYALPSDETYRGILKIDANGVPYADGDRKLPDGTINRRYGYIELDGSSDEEWIISGSTQNNQYIISVPNVKRSNTAVGIVCNRLLEINGSDGYNANNLTGISSWLTQDPTQGQIRVSLDTSIVNRSVDGFKTWLSNNPLQVAFPLEHDTTEEGTPYTEEQITNNWGTEELVSTTLVPVGHVTDYHPDLRAKVEASPESPDTDGLYLMKRENGQNSYVAYLGELPSDPTTDGTYTLKCTVSGGTATKTWEAGT